MAGTLNEHSHGLAPVQMRSERKRSADLAEFDAITMRDEQWRYVEVSRLKGLDNLPMDEFSGDIELQAPDAVSASWIDRDHALFGSAGLPEDRAAAAAWGAASQAYLISIPDNFVGDQPVYLTLRGDHLEAGRLGLEVGAQEDRAQAAGQRVVALDGLQQRLDVLESNPETKPAALRF